MPILSRFRISKAHRGAWHMVGAPKITYYRHFMYSDVFCSLFPVCLFLLNSKFHETANIALFTDVSPVPGTMPGTLCVLHGCS